MTNVGIATANGFSGTVLNPTATPNITIGTSVTGLLKGNGTGVSAATPGTDYVATTSPTGSLILASGTTAQRDGIPTAGYFRYNSSLIQWEGWNSTNWVSFATGGSGGSGGVTITQEVQTATAGQAAFTIATTTYVPGTNRISIYVNGLKLIPSDYVETSSIVVTLNLGLKLGDQIQFVCIN